MKENQIFISILPTLFWYSKQKICLFIFFNLITTMEGSIQPPNLRKNRNQLFFFSFFKLSISLVLFWLLQSLIHPTSTLTPGSILYFPAIWTVFTLLRRKLNLFMNKENPLTLFPSWLYSCFLNSFLKKKLLCPLGSSHNLPFHVYRGHTTSSFSIM